MSILNLAVEDSALLASIRLGIIGWCNAAQLPSNCSAHKTRALPLCGHHKGEDNDLGLDGASAPQQAHVELEQGEQAQDDEGRRRERAHELQRHLA